jgi:hypothetical protein
MSKGTKDKIGINKIPEEEHERIDINNIEIKVDNDERVLIEKLAHILHKIIVEQPDKSFKPLIPDKSLAGFSKSALSFMSNVYMTNVLSKSEVAKNLPDKQALNEFIAFRKKYMNFPVGKQIADLKRVGIVK